MTRSIWKFPLEIVDEPVVRMPRGALVLSVGVQNRVVMLWATVDTEAENATRRFAIVGTGNPYNLESHAVFVGTAHHGPFVWHVFDLGEVQP